MGFVPSPSAALDREAAAPGTALRALGSARSQGAACDPWEMRDGGRRARGKEQEEKGVPLSPPVPLSVR